MRDLVKSLIAPYINVMKICEKLISYVKLDHVGYIRSIRISMVVIVVSEISIRWSPESQLNLKTPKSL